MAAMDAVVQSSDARVMAAAAVSVDVYVHVVTTSTKQGRYTQAMVNEQISVMVRMEDSHVPFIFILTTAAERRIQQHGSLLHSPRN